MQPYHSATVAPHSPSASVGGAVLHDPLRWMGIRTTARTNQILLAFMSLVMAGVFSFAAVRIIVVHQHWQGLVSLQPMYDRGHLAYEPSPPEQHLRLTTYIGFDGVSILAEELHNPRRNVLLATVLAYFP